MSDNKNAGGKMSAAFNAMKPYLAMLSLQFGYAGMHIVILVSFKKGFSHWIFVTYRHAIATLFFAPFAYYLEKKVRPKMTKSVLFKILVLAFLEPVMDQNLYGIGIQYTSASFAAASVNVLPSITFIMAVIFRMEKLNLKKASSVAKVIGTVITVAGATLIALYKGPALEFLTFSRGGNHQEAAANAADQHWVLGVILMLGCIVGWAGFFILQNKTLDEYPCPLSLTTLICLFGTLESGMVAAVMERHLSAWAIGFDSRLLAAAYSGIICSGIAYYLQSVVNRAKGPVFVTSFSPLSMIITAILSAMILAEQVHLGSLIGAAIVVSGLYCVVWGKSREGSAAAKLGYDDQELPVVVDKNSNINLDGGNVNGTTIVKPKNALQLDP